MVHITSPFSTFSPTNLFIFIPTLGSILSSLFFLPAPNSTDNLPSSKASILLTIPTFTRFYFY